MALPCSVSSLCLHFGENPGTFLPPLGPRGEAEEGDGGDWTSSCLELGQAVLWSWHIGGEIWVCPEIAGEAGPPWLYGGGKGRRPADSGVRLGTRSPVGLGDPPPLLELHGQSAAATSWAGWGSPGRGSRARTWRPLVAECRPCQRRPEPAGRPRSALPSTAQAWRVRGRDGAGVRGPNSTAWVGSQLRVPSLCSSGNLSVLQSPHL